MYVPVELHRFISDVMILVLWIYSCHPHHHCRNPLHPRVPLIHDPQGCLQQAVMGLCQDVAAPASAPARPRPGPGTALICSHSSSRQSVKHWGKIFCLPEQLLINCPFIDAQDKFCRLSPSISCCPPPLLYHYTLSHFHNVHMLWSSLSACSSAPCGLVKLAHSLYLSINYGDAKGAPHFPRSLCKRQMERKRNRGGS